MGCGGVGLGWVGGLNPLAFTVPTLWGSGGWSAWPEPVGVHSSNTMGVGRLARFASLQSA